ncbi:MAG: hypothetical protein REI11_20160, partial [Patulibacter sp.]|nr:hypothetical protein [Patulibacter sp.]
SWLAVPIAARSHRAGQLLAPVGGVLAVGAAAALTLLVVRPLLSIALGDPAPAAGLLLTLTAAMTVAAALATALAMAVARRANAPWAACLAATVGLGIVIATLRPDGPELAAFVLTAQAAALAGTTWSLLRTAESRPAPVQRTPLLARR